MTHNNTQVDAVHVLRWKFRPAVRKIGEDMYYKSIEGWDFKGCSCGAVFEENNDQE